MKIDSARQCEGTRYDCDDVNDLRQCDGRFFVLYRWVTGIVIILSIVCSLARSLILTFSCLTFTPGRQNNAHKSSPLHSRSNNNTAVDSALLPQTSSIAVTK